MQSKPPAQPRRSRLPKYTRERSDYNLDEALQDWREDKTAAVFGWAALNDLGPSLIMTNALLDRIIDCAHHHKIHTIQDLRKETSWMDIEKYGEEVVAIIRQHAAPLPSPFNTVPLRSGTGLLTAANTPTPSRTYTIHPQPSTSINSPSTSDATSIGNHLSSVQKQRVTCGNCGQEGHNARNRACPRHPSHTTNMDLANTSC
ncbi:hypothetical protein BU15DRAFT_77554 [Melanogaster broomeanus]|nr:hypothetical protein BU15DRAFT_77554 [Melanogaster broomeanus]